MLFVERELNSIIFNEENFHPKKNYMPEFVLALRELDKDKTIHFALDIKSTPLLFILYFRKLKQSMPNLDLELYFKDKSELLPKTLATYHLKYKNITEFPWELPHEDNTKEEIDPYASIEGIDDIELINSLKAQAQAQEELSKIPDVHYLHDNDNDNGNGNGNGNE